MSQACRLDQPGARIDVAAAGRFLVINDVNTDTAAVLVNTN